MSTTEQMSRDARPYAVSMQSPTPRGGRKITPSYWRVTLQNPPVNLAKGFSQPTETELNNLATRGWLPGSSVSTTEPRTPLGAAAA
jgi:hypothetical protein